MESEDLLRLRLWDQLSRGLEPRDLVRESGEPPEDRPGPAGRIRKAIRDRAVSPGPGVDATAP